MPIFLKDLLKEEGEESRYWWMDKDGNLIPVGDEKHSPVARDILKYKYNVLIAFPNSVYSMMYKKGYIRIGYAGFMGKYRIEVNYDPNYPPSRVQWSALNDLAIKMRAESIKDNTSGKEIRID